MLSSYDAYAEDYSEYGGDDRGSDIQAKGNVEDEYPCTEAYEENETYPDSAMRYMAVSQTQRSESAMSVNGFPHMHRNAQNRAADAGGTQRSRSPVERCKRSGCRNKEAGCGEDCDFRMRSLGGGRRGYAESIGDKQRRTEGAGKVNGGAAYPADDVEHKAHSVAPVADYRSILIHFALAHAHTSPRTNETVPSCIALSSNTDTFTADAASSLHIAETYTPRSVGSV